MWVLARFESGEGHGARLIPVKCPIGYRVCSSSRNGYRCKYLTRNKQGDAFVYCKALRDRVGENNVD